MLVFCVPVWADERGQQSADNRADLHEAIRYESITRTDPRPLRIHVLRCDLHAPGFELAVAVGEDTDGDGPIEASLTPPRALARDARLVAAVNANPWRMIPPTTDGVPTPYLAGLGCDVSGWAVTDGDQRSAPQAGHWNVWAEGTQRVRMGEQPETGGVQQAVAGFRGLIRRGQTLPEPSQVLHPRTAAGTDREGRWLVLVVVDGRQPAYSEGMSERELAELMAELGCFEAINLDGGGSSSMLLEDEQGHLRLQNRPSDRVGPRAVPVMLGIRRRLEPSG
ncbi:MAG: phosphodiester glycosidase family protein [Pirellulaceae bacterium]|nr:phosphodiester glycosidase family protein [Pirellulaceae bacterium]